MNQTDHLFTSEKLLEILSLSQNATAIYTGGELTIQMANMVMLDYWGKDQAAIGLPLIKAVPELAGQPLTGLLQNVWRTGESYEAKDSRAELTIDGKLQTFYFDFLYRAIKDKHGNMESILHTATDVSERVAARQLMETAAAHKAVLDNEQAQNEELRQAKIALSTLNRELESRVRDRTKELTESESRLRSLITHAPVAIGVLKGRELLIETANAKLLQIWGRPASVIGQPLATALPELEGQPFLQILDEVFTTGTPYYSYEVPGMLENDGVLKQYYLDLLYQPILNNTGLTESIFVVATDLTLQVNARKEVEQFDEMQRFTIEAAGVGTWRLYPATERFIASGRLNEMFGFAANEEISYAQAISRIPEEHRHRIEEDIKSAMAGGINYNVEHPVSGFEDNKLRWVRAIGKVNTDSDGGESYLSGIVMDITEQKQDEQRKNDFIGMVSHELKTPLTSLSGYLQMLLLKARKAEDGFQAGVLEKADKQVKKMTRMVHSFLTVSRLTAGKIYLDMERFDIEELVEEIVEESRLVYPDHLINFKQCKSILINADRDKIGQVVTNFISNAVKYAPENKVIDVACRDIGNEVKINVSDYGYGIKPEDKAKLFERYYRVENGPVKNIAGFGIGLYLCSEIVSRHQGQIGVESVLGKGSTFYFTLKSAPQDVAY